MNKNKKILFLLHLPPPFHGSSIVGLNIKKNVVINKTFDCYYINLLASNHLNETGKVNFKKIFGFVITFAKVFRLLIFKRPKLCYLALTVTGAALYKDLILVALLKIFCVKRLYHLHNKGVSLHKDKIINRICYRYLFKNAEVIILSKYLYFDVQHFVPKSKLHICPNGVDDEGKDNTENAGIKQHKAELPIVNILFLSNLIESKGVFVLLEALSLLKKKQVLFECVFIGGEGNVTSSQFTERKTKLGLNGQVSYQGQKYSEKAFLKADIFAFPTYYSNECLPLVLLEAMSYSLPIVSTFEGGIPDVVEDGVTGFLVPQEHIELLAEKLELLIKSSSLRQQMGSAGRDSYEQKFSQKIFEQRFVEILNRVIEKEK